MNQRDYIFTHDIAVRDYELDSEGIVNNAIYLHYLEHTRHAFCREHGISFAAMTAGGITPVVSRIEVDYRVPLRSGDVVSSSLWLDRQGVRFIFHQDLHIRATGALSASAVVTIVCLRDGKPCRGEELATAFAQYIDP